jgi:signal transduction histidine kinase
MRTWRTKRRIRRWCRIEAKPEKLKVSIWRNWSLDVAEDFALLAQENQRAVRLYPMRPSPVFADPKHARQILHNLFTNALKHGRGNILVRIRPRGDRVVLAIANEIRARNTPHPETLGLGLRVVDTLLGLQPEIKYRRRAGARSYCARVSLPTVPKPAG